MKLSRKYLPHLVDVTPMRGESSVGVVFGDPFTLPCMAQGGTRLVRDADGNEVTSSLTLYAEAGTAARVPVGSTVQWGETTTTVLQAIEHDDGGMGAPQHTEVVCQ